MTRIVPCVAALCVIVGFGILQAQLTPQVASQDFLSELAKRLPDLPLVIGDWSGESIESNEVTVRAADAAGILQRRYVNSKDGREVHLMLLVGRPGPLSVHLPEICYQGLGYRSRGGVTNRNFSKKSSLAQFRVIEMTNTNGPVPRYIRVYHSWNNGAGWTTPALPRVTFARSSFLYKLYITTPPLNFLPQDTQDACNEFIETCLPVIQIPESSTQDKEALEPRV